MAEPDPYVAVYKLNGELQATKDELAEALNRIENLTLTNRAMVETVQKVGVMYADTVVELAECGGWVERYRTSRNAWKAYAEGLRGFLHVGQILIAGAMIQLLAFAGGFVQPFFDGPQLWATLIGWF